MKTQAIIPTAGVGARMNSSVAKPFIELKGKPLFAHCLITFELCPSVESVIVVGEKDKLKDIEAVVKKYSLDKVKKVVEGGERRCDSVANGLAALDDDTQCVVIHDSARPLVTVDIIEQTIHACAGHKAVIAGVKVKPTIKRVSPGTNLVDATLDRSMLWEIQTPQVFDKDLILKAHKLNKDNTPIDDAALVERLGDDVKVIEGSYSNIKVTTAEDLKIAEMYLS